MRLCRGCRRQEEQILNGFRFTIFVCGLIAFVVFFGNRPITTAAPVKTAEQSATVLSNSHSALSQSTGGEIK
jgi:hypothetical protein